MIPQDKRYFRSCVLGFILALLVAKVACSQEETNLAERFSSIDDKSESYFFYQQSEYPRDCLEIIDQCSSASSSGVYLIKPDGYPNPFDVYCDSEGFTVVERRIDGAINFNRSWGNYESGFGFPSTEFWIGNQKLSFLTNQKVYTLQIDVTLTDGSTFQVAYDRFRISDAHDNYKLLSLGQYEGTVMTCPANMIPGNCTSHRSCADPDTCAITCHVTGSCVCPDGYLMDDSFCVTRNQCGCFIAEADDGNGTVVVEGGIYVSPNCSRRCSCISGRLDCEEDFQCSPHATCWQSDGGWNCSCNADYEGDGGQCTPIVAAADCQDIFNSDQTNSGVYVVKPDWSEDPFQVYCNMEDGGGWMVFQRQDRSEDFYRYWDDYKNGFGSPVGGLWLGNDKLHNFTSQADYELRIDFTDRDGRKYYATYSLFRISDESDKYKLTSVGTHSSNTGYDALTWHVNKKFSTRDQDNDDWSSYDCANEHQGAWWFAYHNNCPSSSSGCRSNCPTGESYCDRFPVGSGCATCADVFLNTNYGGSTPGRNLYWDALSTYDCFLQYSEMKIRPART